MESENRVEIPKIDFSGLYLDKVGTMEWEKAKEKVMEALDKYGCFEAVFDCSVTMELRDEFFGPMMDELFQVPLDLKMRNHSDVPFQGYVPRLLDRGFNCESLSVVDASSYSFIQDFASLLLKNHQRQHAFSEVAWKFTKDLKELELMVRRMVVEGLGVEKHFGSLMELTMHSLRMSEYGAPVNQETMVVMTHRDMNLLTIVYQHHGQGFEMQTKSGDWVGAAPCSFSVIIGESFQAWSNGRLSPTVHRVKMPNNDTRHSLLFGSRFKYGRVIQAPDELVNQDHPLQYKPFTYEEYLNFLFSEEPWGREIKTLKAYCGVEGKEMVP